MPHPISVSASLDEPTVLETTPMPPGYIFVPKGNVYITKTSRTLTHTANQKLYIVRSARNAKTTLGLRIPRTIHAQVLALAKATAAARSAAVAKKDAGLETRMRAELLSAYPHVPADRVRDILKHTLQKRSGRVGRATDLPLGRVVGLAVEAYVRHQLTDYEGMLRRGVEREVARREIRPVVEGVVAAWGGMVRGVGRAKDGFRAKSKRVRGKACSRVTGLCGVKKGRRGKGQKNVRSHEQKTTAIAVRLKGCSEDVA